MTVSILAAGVAAFLISFVFGSRLIPWLERRNIQQSVKVEVEEKIYRTADGDSDADS